MLGIPHPSSFKKTTFFLQLLVETKVFPRVLLPKFIYIQFHKPIMTSLPQIQRASTLDRLSDDILRLILDLAMARDSPFYIDDPRLGLDRITYQNGRPHLHDRTLQPVHRMDWIAINSTNRRIRALGKVSFFSMKTFAIHKDLPARLQRNDHNAIKGMMLDDQALALPYIRDIIIVDSTQTSPSPFLALPQTLAAFPCLRRCTLLFRFNEPFGELITNAFLLGRPVDFELQEHMVAIGMPRHFRLEETLGSGSNWEDHRKLMEKHIYPMLRFKSKLLQAK
jgi:hypothetical protein